MFSEGGVLGGGVESAAEVIAAEATGAGAIGLGAAGTEAVVSVAAPVAGVLVSTGVELGGGASAPALASWRFDLAGLFFGAAAVSGSGWRDD